VNHISKSLTYVIPYFDKSGPMRAPYLICKGFVESGWDTNIITISSPENADIDIAWNKVPVERVIGSTKIGKAIKLGLELLRKRERRVVISWVWYWHCFAMMVSKILFDSPYVLALDTYTFHADWDIKSKFSRLRLELRYGIILRNADIILAESPLSYEHAIRYLKKPRVLQVPVCLWEKDLKRIEESWEQVGYHPVRKPIILFTGRIVPDKRIHDLLEAFNSLAYDFPDWNLEIRGPIKDVEYFTQLRDKVETYQLTSRIDFLPSLMGQDLYKRYREAAIYCLPTGFEGIPTAILEAMYFGSAIVSGNAGSVSYQLDDGYCGLLFEPGDIDSLRDHLKTLMGSEVIRESLMRKARKRFLQCFIWEKYFEEIERNFRGLVTD
jgi:glycosyltransferase involved in cell wall biosynthesis